MAEKVNYIAMKKRIMDFQIGNVVLAMIKCDNKRESSKASIISRIMLDTYTTVGINRISRLLETISDGISVEQAEGDDKIFHIINFDEKFKSYSMNYNELFNLFIETLVEYPIADKPIEQESFFKEIKKEQDKFIKFIQKFADNFNFKEQEFALFEMGQILSYAGALYLNKSNTNIKSPWFKLGEFIRNPKNCLSICESATELT